MYRKCKKKKKIKSQRCFGMKINNSYSSKLSKYKLLSKFLIVQIHLIRSLKWGFLLKFHIRAWAWASPITVVLQTNYKVMYFSLYLVCQQKDWRKIKPIHSLLWVWRWLLTTSAAIHLNFIRTTYIQRYPKTYTFLCMDIGYRRFQDFEYIAVDKSF